MKIIEEQIDKGGGYDIPLDVMERDLMIIQIRVCILTMGFESEGYIITLQ